jgi:hypothetical protein
MENDPRPLSSFEQDIAALEALGNGLGHRVAERHSERSILGFQAEWHMRGVLYHVRRLFEVHGQFVHEVSVRASTGATALIMYAPSYQQLLFEFYALVNLSRISLDNLRVYLAPLFIRQSDHLPKSVRDVLKGSTNCPVYNSLSGQDVVYYLLDLRNCLVHYRSFATSDNAIVYEQGADASGVVNGGDEYFAAMARADFRRVSGNTIAVNILLPDRIFESATKGDKRLAHFTFHQRWNLLSMARTFAQLATMSLTEALKALATIDTPIFEFSAKPKTSQPGVRRDA